MSTEEPYFGEYNDDPIENLRRAAKALRELRFPTSPMDARLVEFLAGGIEKYLAGAKSLDHSLGLKCETRGRKPQFLDLIVRIVPMRWGKQAWKKILRKTGYRGSASDLERLFRKYRAEAEPIAIHKAVLYRMRKPAHVLKRNRLRRAERNKRKHGGGN